MSSLALKLRNTLESLKRNASAEKWVQVRHLFIGRKSTEFLSNSLILTLLKLIERDLLSKNPKLKKTQWKRCIDFDTDRMTQCTLCVRDLLCDLSCRAVLESAHIESLILILLKTIESHSMEGECLSDANESLNILCDMNLPNELAGNVGPVILTRLSNIPPSFESLKIIDTVLDKCPRLIMQFCSSWFIKVLRALSSPDSRLSDDADRMLCKWMPYFYEDDTGSEFLETLKSEHCQDCIALMQSQSPGDSILLLKLWGYTILAFKHTIHRTHVLNTMLSLIEGTFNKGKPMFRAAAFKAWRRLIVNLASKEGHLFNPKRVGLVLLPIWNGLRYEKMESVRAECIQSMIFLFVNLSFHSPLKPLLETVLTTAIEDKDISGKMDFQLPFWRILVILSTPKPRMSVSLRDMCEQMDQPPDLLLRWMNPAPEEDLPFFAEVLLKVLEKEQQSTQMRLPQEEAAIADLFKAATNLSRKVPDLKFFDERLRNIEDYFKASNFSSEFLSETTGTNFSFIKTTTPGTPNTGFKALLSDSINYVSIPPMSEAELAKKQLSDGIRTERQSEKKVETSVKMYNSLDPSQILTIEHLENLVNIPATRYSSPIRTSKRPRMDEKENVPVGVSINDQLQNFIHGHHVTQYQTRDLMQLQKSLLDALNVISDEVQRRLS